ncbi:apolipoprotein N-acyltransferase [bacterium]|nr:apolipoprotein N-acyltransferase [bacterium]
MSKSLKIAICVLAPALFFYLAWPPRDLFFLSFVALVPLLYLADIELKGWKYFMWTYLSLLLFNTAVTWWVWNASPGGSVFMLFANSLLFSLAFVFYRQSKIAIGTSRALMAFCFYWLSLEYLHLNWEINWPWLNLGNVFAKHVNFVQWYEYTGALGGSLWVLSLNVFIYQLIATYRKRHVYKLVFTLGIPVLISFYILYNLDLEPKETLKIAAVQPNIDPYNKFDAGTELSNLEAMLKMTEEEMDSETDLVLMPETAIVQYIDEDQVNRFKSFWLLKQFIEDHPRTHIVTGVSTYNFYDKDEKRSPTARETEDGEYYESYNTVWEVNGEGISNDYHKIKLVPGVEKMPYPKVFAFLENLAIDMGGVTGSLGSDEEPKVFQLDEKPDVAPLICYESIFPGFAAQFVQKGAEVLCVVTNDGWWGNTGGHKQHMYYACLRAIENRKDVVRSANTGISCHINYKGEILDQLPWWEAGVLNAEAKTYDKQTFFTRFGDYIGRFASFLGVFMLLSVFVKRLNKHG